MRTIFCLVLAVTVIFLSSCSYLEKSPFPSTRDVNVLVSSINPSSIEIRWQKHISNDCDCSLWFWSYTEPSEVAFTFTETLGRTWAQIESMSVAFSPPSSLSGVDLSSADFVQGVSLLVPKGSAVTSQGLQVFSTNLLSLVQPTSGCSSATTNNYSFSPIQSTITFSGKSGVGDSFSQSVAYAIVQKRDTDVSDVACPATTRLSLLSPPS